MSTRGSSGGASGGATASASQGMDTTQRTFEGVQLARLAARLRNVSATRDLVRALGEDPDKYAVQLAKQYQDLFVKTRSPPPPRAPSLPLRLSQSLDKIGTIFNLWDKVLAPNATAKLVQVPSGPDIGGTGIGAEIFQGQIALGGEVWNGGPHEQWWVNTWQYMVPLPATPANIGASASLSYRFNIGASLAFYRQDVVSGSVHAYATVATTGDLAGHPVDFNNFVSSEFAIVGTLPVPGVPPIIGGTAKFSGTIPLVPGKTPAIGIIVGLIISVADGDVLILPGEFSNITLAPPDATTPSDLGKIEYRRDPLYWVEAVAKMIAT